MTERRRAVGIVRVSHVGARAGDSFTSPDVQRERIVAECEREDLELVEVFDELDVSGGKALDKRPGLRRAVEMIEAGQAQVIVAAYFDRLVRSLATQAEVLARVDAAGGKVRAVDAGDVGERTSGEWLNATMRGMFAEYQRRQGGERTRDADLDAIRRGVAPWPIPPTGYVCPREADGQRRAPVRHRRDDRPGAACGVRAPGHSVAHTGSTKSAADALVPQGSRQPSLEPRVRRRAAMGRAPEPERVAGAGPDRPVRALPGEAPRAARPADTLGSARLGVLRCASCDGRMTVNGVSDTAANYRCPTIGCADRVSIVAKLIEDHVVIAARAALLDIQGRASMIEQRGMAEQALEHAQADLDAAVRVLAVVGDEQSAMDRLTELRQARDAARDTLSRFDRSGAVATIDVLADWDSLQLPERRALIRAAIRRVTVSPGRGLTRVRVDLATSGAV